MPSSAQSIDPARFSGPGAGFGLRSSFLPLVAAAAVLAAGCATSPSEALDPNGDPIPRGQRLTYERWDDPEAFTNARSLVVVPFSVAPEAQANISPRILDSAAVMASQQVVSTLHKSGRLETVDLGRGDENADLFVTGRIWRYVPPSKSTDVMFGGKQRVELSGEVYDSGGNLVGAFLHNELMRGRNWYESEERDLKTLCKICGALIGATIGARIR